MKASNSTCKHLLAEAQRARINHNRSTPVLRENSRVVELSFPKSIDCNAWAWVCGKRGSSRGLSAEPAFVLHDRAWAAAAINLEHLVGADTAPRSGGTKLDVGEEAAPSTCSHARPPSSSSSDQI